VTSKQPFEIMVAEHGATVLRVCRALLGPIDADDAWSETFISAMKAYQDLSSDTDIRAWLVTIAHRKAIDLSRAASRRRMIPTAHLPDVAGPAWFDEYDPELIAAVARLPDKQKRAVAYHYLAGLPYAQVADIIGGSIDAARRSAADGIAALRRTYSDPTTRKGEPR
jgi:RNA polymerase sigma factor (sigma-70 family)